METKKLRAAIKHIEGAWVRNWKDGTVWAGHKNQSAIASEKVAEALRAAGYKCRFNGEPGTAGQFVIEVKEASK